mmetsp:Transcript_18326/g.38305  ORF Transcript_18326/g.38305 Transcript_18326/m.38305 type:complete len:232 (-) Transcript_18326:279-974(-)|eukprot:CAMPEP_0184687830 /NCGR_PEP_ID=MMETSP0312-20130426/27680_1 /TAXON_ID=31354 /ORGANISM="Compsopogon coeruleus, Strain SAG 36.94" /LENGTH=231 /DNA_ID=CAMNT_0027144359 /DNA_START=73 /DNA_END=768 /DNA_ORIENTATION=-
MSKEKHGCVDDTVGQLLSRKESSSVMEDGTEAPCESCRGLDEWMRGGACKTLQQMAWRSAPLMSNEDSDRVIPCTIPGTYIDYDRRRRGIDCGSIAMRRAVTGASIGATVHLIQGVMNYGSAGYRTSVVIRLSIIAGAVGAYDWAMFVGATAWTRCQLQNYRGRTDLINLVVSGAVGGCAGTLLGSDVVTAGFAHYRHPVARAQLMASARRNAAAGAAFVTILNLIGAAFV